jgi:hypothetical protein
MNPDDDLLARLPSHDVNPAVSERIVRQAHSMLRERGRQSHRAAFWLSTYYHRFVEPAALIALGLSYLALTVRDTLGLFQP